MERSGSRLSRLINDLLDLAKIESGKVRLRYQPIALGPFLRSIALPFRMLAEREAARAQGGGRAPPSPLLADPERLGA